MAYTLHVEGIYMTADGVRYLLVACDNVEIFADRDVVLCVSTGSPFYNTEAFHYDEATGAITAEPDYAGVNLVFDLPLDAAKADPTAAQAFLDEWQAKPSSGVSWQDRADTSALHSLMEKYPEAATDDAMDRVADMSPAGSAGRYFGTSRRRPLPTGTWAPAGTRRMGLICPRRAGPKNRQSLSGDGSDGDPHGTILIKSADCTMTSETWQLPEA